MVNGVLRALEGSTTGTAAAGAGIERNLCEARWRPRQVCRFRAANIVGTTRQEPPSGGTMPLHQSRVLVCGASVAGPVLAYWLHRFGFTPTVIERTSEMRLGDGGHAVDLLGPAVELMEWMGVLPEVQTARTRTRVVSFIRADRRPVDVPAEALAEGISERHIEIMRGDLARIISTRAREQVEYIFDDSVATLHDTGTTVEVTFERGAPRTYDLVIGADGLHSTTRGPVSYTHLTLPTKRIV